MSSSTGCVAIMLVNMAGMTDLIVRTWFSGSLKNIESLGHDIELRWTMKGRVGWRIIRCSLLHGHAKP